MKMTEKKLKAIAAAIESVTWLSAYDTEIRKDDFGAPIISFTDGNNIPHEIHFSVDLQYLEIFFRDEKKYYHWYASMKLENQSEYQVLMYLAIILKNGQDQAIDYYEKEWEKAHSAG